MLLAGLGSTAAAVISSISLGVAAELDRLFVLDEVLRLYPPSFMIARIITSQSSALPFSPGDTVVISPWLIHRNPAGWSEPAEFRLDRWRGPRNGPAWFLPFGLGARRCPASAFARVVATSAAKAARNVSKPGRVQVELVEGRSPALVPRCRRPRGPSRGRGTTWPCRSSHVRAVGHSIAPRRSIPARI